MVRAIGWELHYRDASANSNKVYRVIVTHRLLITNYAKYGALGQFQFQALPSLAQVRDRAVRITTEKERKGYRASRPVTEFEIALDDYSEVCDGDQGVQRHVRQRILDNLLAAAPELTHD
ncbi:UNVERIFIED_ORG: putative DNA-binding WGR domain protein [Microbispora rosea subsp. rosea]